jgi:hypothetical protein
VRVREILDSPRDQSLRVRDLGPRTWDRRRLPWDLRALPTEICFFPWEMAETLGMGRLASSQNVLNCKKLRRMDGGRGMFLEIFSVARGRGAGGRPET